MRERRHSPHDHGPQLAAYALGVFVVLAPQALGGATPETELAILATGSVLALLSAVALRKVQRSLGAAPWATVGAAIAAGWTLGQIVPLPCSLVGAAFPERMEMVAQLVKLGALDRPVCTLSGAPGSTQNALAFAATLCALMLVATALSRAGFSKILIYGIVASSAIMALVAIGHVVFVADRVFGLYTPRLARPGLLLAPLLNANHLAGHLALGFPLCIWMGAKQRRLDARICWFATGALILTCGVLTLSRGGVGALALGGSSCAALLLWGRKKGAILPREWVSLAIATLGVAALLFHVSGELEQMRAEGGGVDKLDFIRRVGVLVWAHPLVGVGRGAMGDETPNIMAVWALFAENFAAQWAIEWGFPVAGLLLGSILLSVIHKGRWAGSRKALACGLFALCLQNLVDFSLELAGVASAAAVATGVLLASEKVTPPLNRLRLRGCAAVAPCFALIACLFAVPTLTSKSRASFHHELVVAQDRAPEEFRRMLGQALTRYPRDPELYIRAADDAVRRDRPDAAAWLNLAMRSAEFWPGPHLCAAQYLQRRARLSQAATELSLAGDSDVSNWYDPACSFIHRHPQADLAFGALPTSPASREHASSVMLDCLVPPAERERLAGLVLAETPSHLKAQLVAVEIASQRGEHVASIARAQALVEQRPDVPETWILQMTVLMHAGKFIDAFARFLAAPEPVRGHLLMLTSAAHAALYAKDLGSLKIAVGALLAHHGTNAMRRAQLQAEASSWYASVGDQVTALELARAAFDANPTTELAELTHAAALRANAEGVALLMAAELCQVGARKRWYCAHPTQAAP